MSLDSFIGREPDYRAGAMPRTTIIANASELITLKGPRRSRTKSEMSDLSIIKGGAVVVSEGMIVEVGRTETILKEHLASGVEVLEAGGRVVMPGFVDPHTHLVFAGSRESELEQKLKGMSYMEIMASGGGIHRTVRETRAADDDSLYDQSAARLASMVAHGSTTVEVKSGYGLDKDTELRMLRAVRRLEEAFPVDLVPTFMGAHALPPEFADRPDDYVGFVADEVLPEVARQGLARFCDVFCEKGAFDVVQSRKVLEAAKALGLGLKVHADEFEQSGGAELAAELGAVSADHLARPSDDGLMAMARKDVIGVMLPGTPYTSLSGAYADARRLIDLGVPIALGTDLNPNCWNESMQFTMSLACYKLRMTPAEAVTAATINAAAAVGLEKRVGTLERGKRADILVMDVKSHTMLPYRFGTNLCSVVMKGGEVVWRSCPAPSSRSSV